VNEIVSQSRFDNCYDFFKYIYNALKKRMSLREDPIPFRMTGFTLKRIEQADSDRMAYGTLENPQEVRRASSGSGLCSRSGSSTAENGLITCERDRDAGNAGGDSERRNPNLT